MSSLPPIIQKKQLKMTRIGNVILLTQRGLRRGDNDDDYDDDDDDDDDNGNDNVLMVMVKTVVLVMMVMACGDDSGHDHRDSGDCE